MTLKRRVLVLGGSGMLGHKLLQTLHRHLEVYATVQSDAAMRACLKVLPDLASDQFQNGVDAMDFDTIRGAIAHVQPQVVVNCIGVVKQSTVSHQAVLTVHLNALLPHQLAELCIEKGIRLILFSTDCVFSGRRGNYSEDDIPDPLDLYGRSKLLGEVNQAGCLTLRSSIVGWELQHQQALLSWFASQRGKHIAGYQRAIFSGLSTLEMARVVSEVIHQWPELSGIFHVAGPPISKFDLLSELRVAQGWEDIDLQPDSAYQCDRSLCGTRFGYATGWTAPGWSVMISELAAERAIYETQKPSLPESGE
jgi:dTDP-4-dehydrorhamnose reductase